MKLPDTRTSTTRTLVSGIAPVAPLLSRLSVGATGGLNFTQRRIE